MKAHVRFGLIAGNVLHHYDTALFGWVVPFLAPLLFPGKSGFDALLLTFSLLPLTYLAKPLGALFWGWIGDRFGRKKTVLMTLAGTTVSTFLIGCLPLTERAWMFLALFRILQGFFSIGEEKGSILFLLENTKNEKRAWVSALYDASGILGIFIASLLASCWGKTHWRVLFWLSAFAGLLAILLRRRGSESGKNLRYKFSWKIFWAERASLLKVIFCSGFSYANYYLISVFLNGFIPQITNLTRESMLMLNSHLLWVDCIFLLFFGLACRWVKKELIMGMGALFAAAFVVPAFMYLEGSSWLYVAATRFALVIFGVAFAAPYHAWKIEILPRDHRFLIGSVGAAIGSKLFGSPIPLLSTWLVAKTGSVGCAALPIALLGAVAGVVVLRSKKTVRAGIEPERQKLSDPFIVKL